MNEPDRRTLLPGWQDRIDHAEVEPVVETQSAPLNTAYWADRVIVVADAAAAEAMYGAVASLPVSHIGIDTEFSNMRPPIACDRKGHPHHDIRAIRPLIVSLAVVVPRESGCHILRFVIDVRCAEVLPALQKILRLPVPFVGHFLKAELFVIWTLGLVEPENLWDSYLCERALTLGEFNRRYELPKVFDDSDEAKARDSAEEVTVGHCSLGGTCQRYGVEHRYLHSKGRLQRSFLTMPADAPFTAEQIDYAAEDAVASALLYQPQVDRAARGGILHHLVTIEMPWLPVSCEIEWNGIRVDPDRARRVRDACRRHLPVIEAEIAKLMREVAVSKGAQPRTGANRASRSAADTLLSMVEEREFLLLKRADAVALGDQESVDSIDAGLNLRRSRAALQIYFYLNGKLDLFQKGGRGRDRDKVGFTKDLFKEFQDHDPLISLVYIGRRIDSMTRDYLLAPAIVGADGRVHPEQRQLGTDTGRQTTRMPNIHGLPGTLRPMVVAESGNAIVSVDLCQIEVGVAGHEYGSREMVEMFNKGDVYCGMIRQFNRAVLTDDECALSDDDTKLHPRLKRMRGEAKTLTLALIFGITVITIAARDKSTIAEAKAKLGKFLAMFPGLRAAQDLYATECAARGYATTCSGLRRHRRPMASSDSWERNWMVNLRIQGGAAVAFKKAGIRIRRRLRAMGWRLVLAVHDEFGAEGPAKDKEIAAAIIQQELCSAVQECFPSLHPRAEAQLKHTECWSKDGDITSWSAWLEDFRVLLRGKGAK